MTEAVVFNPSLPGFDADPCPHYRGMRELDPAHDPPLGFWFLTRYDDVAHLLRSGLSVEDRHLADGPVADQSRAFAGERNAVTLSMLDRAPPDHTRLRSLVAKRSE